MSESAPGAPPAKPDRPATGDTSVPLLRPVMLGIRTGGPDLFLHPNGAHWLGVRPQDRVHLQGGDHARVPAIVNLAERFVGIGEVGLSAELEAQFAGHVPSGLSIRPAPRPAAVEFIRMKLDGKPLSSAQLDTVVGDIVAGHLSPIEVTAWAAGIYAHGLTVDETVDYTRAMAASGQRIEWPDSANVVDVHSIGGLPGNKYAPIAVAIAAAAGLVVPKTSSRAISSACGTADFMEVMCPVELGAARIQSVALQTGACLAWGGGAGIAPADDAIIHVEYPLSIDPPAQLVASVLAKKVASGVRKIVLDMPVGAGGKVPARADADRLTKLFMDVGGRLGLELRVVRTAGALLLGRAIGPVLEAREVLTTIKAGDGPRDLVAKSTLLAGHLLEVGGKADPGAGEAMACAILADGRADAVLRRVVAAQGGSAGIASHDLRPGPFRLDAVARADGPLDLRSSALVGIARAAGAPRAHAAGIEFLREPVAPLQAGTALFRVYAETTSRLEDAAAAVERLTALKVEVVPDGAA